MNRITIVIYVSFRDMEIKTFHTTLQSHFIISSSLIVFGHAVSGVWSQDLFIYYLASLPMVYLAHRVGRDIRQRIPIHRCEKLLYLFSVILGILLLISAAEHLFFIIRRGKMSRREL